MTNDEYLRGHLGLHDWLRITKVPATAQGSLVGQRLIDAGVLTVAGVYECEVRVDGLKSLDVRLKATFGSGSSTTSGGSSYADRTTVLQAFVGVGAMATTVEQPITIAALKGEKYAKVIITTVGAVVQFTVAEILGLKA
jgi:hypothetical protein